MTRMNVGNHQDRSVLKSAPEFAGISADRVVKKHDLINAAKSAPPHSDDVLRINQAVTASPAVGLPSSKHAMIRIEPPAAIVADYTPGQQHLMTVKIHNFSSEIQRVSLQPPRSGKFKLRQRQLDNIPIAPGLHLALGIEFNAPARAPQPLVHNGGLNGRNDLQRTMMLMNNKIDSPNMHFGNTKGPQFQDNFAEAAAVKYSDKFFVDVHGQRSMMVPLEAYPEAPRLAFPKSVNLGVAVLKHSESVLVSATKVQAATASALIAAVTNEEESEKLKADDGSETMNMNGKQTAAALKHPPDHQEIVKKPPFLTKTITFRNAGKRLARARLVYDRSLPLRITPATFSLAPEEDQNRSGLPSSCDVQIEFTPSLLGIFETTVHVDVHDSFGSIARPAVTWSGVEDAKDDSFFTVTANVLEQKLVLLAQNGAEEMDPSSLYFGSIYYSQTASLAARLSNSGPGVVRWVITHAGESVPMTSYTNRSQSHEDEENKTAISVSPSEGSLEPYSTTNLTFTFAPRVEPPQRAFSCSQTVHPAHEYQVPMQLKVVSAETESTNQEIPTDLNLIGHAWPLNLSTTKSVFSFESTELASSRRQVFEVVNKSPQLPLGWAIAPVAHFKVIPSSGTLDAGRSEKCQLIFKPNNLGNFRISLALRAFAIGEDGQRSSIGEITQRSSIGEIPLRVMGTCAPPVLVHKEETPLMLPSREHNEKKGNCSSEGSFEISNRSKSRQLIISKSTAGKMSKTLSNLRSSALPQDKEYGYIVGAGAQKRNPVRLAFTAHRRTYDAYISTSRQQRLHRDMTRKFGEDAIALFNLDNGSKNLLSVEDLAITDPENGLVPPETGGARSSVRRAHHDDRTLKGNAKTTIATNMSQADDRKKRQLFDKLIESSTPGKPRLHVAHGLTNTTAGFSDDPLSAEELASIYTAANTVDFGNITVHSSSNRPLNFLNATSGAVVNVSVSVEESRDPGLSTLTFSPGRIFIPPMSICGVDLAVQSHIPGIYQKKITYLVNGRYKYRIPVTVNVIPVNLTLSIQKVDLEAIVTARPDGVVSAPSSTITMQLKNPGDFHAKFKWRYASHDADVRKFENGSFSVTPLSGLVDAKQTINITITYQPGLTPTYSDLLHLDILDEVNANGEKLDQSDTVVKSISLPTHGEIRAAKCMLLTSIKQGPIDLGILSVSEPASALLMTPPFPGSNVGSRIIKIKNISSNAAYFQAKCTELTKSELQMEPEQGIISGSGEVMDIRVWVTPSVPGTVMNTVDILVAGGSRVLRVPVKYEAQIPNVEITTASCKMEVGTILGSWSSAPIEVTNKGPVIARLIIDARDHPEFEIALQSGDKIAAQHKTSTATVYLHEISPTDAAYSWHGYTANVAAKKTAAASVLTDSALGLADAAYSAAGDAANSGGKLYVVDVQSLSTVQLDLTFRPRTIRVHNFYLPIHLFGGGNTRWNLPISAEGVPSPLEFSKRKIMFKNKVVFKDPASFGVSHLAGALRDMITLTNNSTKALNFWLDTEDAEEENVFRFDPIRGSLVSGDSTLITVLFQPDFTGQFSATVPVHLDLIGTAPFVLEMQGAGVEPSLVFNPPELFLPVVPLGVETSVAFTILNYGCERAEVKCNVPEDIAKLGVSLFFPEGKLLKADGEMLTVLLRFSGKSPVSFKSRIEFRDNSGRAFFLPFRGTTDNSILTLSAYLHMTRSEHVFAVQGMHGAIKYERVAPAVPIDENQKRTRLLTKSKIFVSPGGVPLENVQDTLKYFQSIGETARRWLDDHGVTNVNSAEFPKTFIVSNGKQLYELLAVVSGRKSIVFATSQISSAQTADERAWLLYKQYSELLDQLILVGALLNNVEAEYLLSFDDYVRVYRLKSEQLSFSSGSSQEEHIEHQKKMESYFSCISAEAWATLLLQIIRVHVLGPITMRQFRSLAGIGKDEASMQMQLSGSNIYSLPEAIILKWVSYHAFKRSGTLRRIVNFDSDFQDGTVLAYLIASHLPSFAETRLSNFSLNPDTSDLKTSNAKIVVAALTELYGSIDISAPAISRGSTLDIFLLCCFLYQTLPQLIPRSVIEYNGKLHERIQRYIELSNVGNKSITYVVKLEGAPEFTTKESSVFLPPKALHKLSVEMVGKFSRNIRAQLKIRSKRLCLNNNSMLVFSLVSLVEKAAPRKTYHMEAHVYQTPGVSLDAIITNPFPTVGRFSLQVNQTQPTANTEMVRATPDTADDVFSTTQRGPPPAFRIPLEDVVFPPEGTIVLPVHFIPFEPGTHLCVLHFIDENIGEFTYAIEGQATLPPTTEVLQWTCKAGTKIEKPLRVNPFNSARDKALYASMLGVSRSAAKARQKDPALMQQQSGVSTSPAAEDRESYILPKQPLRYKVECSSPFYHGPAEITVRPPANVGREHKHSVQLDQNFTELPITFHPKVSGKYNCTIVLSCMEASDYRVFAVEGISMSEGSKADLEFSVPARQTITQEIPVVNKTSDDWTVKATLQAQNFFGPYVITAKAHQTTLYPIDFRPTKAGEENGVLHLSNIQTAQKHTYHLKGIAQDPLPEEALTYRCRARERVLISLTVRNYGDDESGMEYDVVHPSPAPAGLENTNPIRTLTIKPGESVEYDLQLHVRCSGTFKYNVKFVPRVKEEQTVTHVWYSLDLHASLPPAEGCLKLRSIVRQASTMEIQLINPLATGEDLEYSVDIGGTGVYGDTSVILYPGERRNFKLVYSPMLVNNSRGHAIFRSPRVGEFWYDLDLEAVGAPKVQLPSMSCPLGKSQNQIIQFQNPLETPVTVEVRNSSPRDFFLTDEDPANTLDTTATDNTNARHLRPKNQKSSLEFEPLEAKTLWLAFYPSSLGEVQQCRIDFVSADIGSAAYEVEGEGIVPNESMEATNVHCNLESIKTCVVGFVNPFVDPVTVGVRLVLENEKHADGFQLITTHQHRRSKRASSASIGEATSLSRLTPIIMHSVAGLGRLDIPLAFTPAEMTAYAADVVVEAYDRPVNETTPLRWIFPIRGVVESSAIVLGSKDGRPVTPRPRSPGTEGARNMELPNISISTPRPLSALLSASTSQRGSTPPTQPKQFSTKARETMMEEIDVLLPGYEFDPAGNQKESALASSILYEVEYTPEFEALVHRTVGISIESASRHQRGLSVRFKFIFTPARPDVLPLTMKIKKKPNGGVWRLPLQLIATPPAIDDVITLEGFLNKTSTSTFTIPNPSEIDRPFKAYFTPETSSHFSIAPTSGILKKQKDCSETDNQFTVGCTFTDYGKAPVGTLVVEAEETSWSFEVRGVLPRYTTPSGDRRRSLASGRTLTPLLRAQNESGSERRLNHVRANSIISSISDAF